MRGSAYHSLCISASPRMDPGEHMWLAMLVPASVPFLSHTTLAQGFMLSHRTNRPFLVLVMLSVTTVQLDGAVCDHDAVCDYD